MKQQIIDLWKVSFGDSDEFIQLYFDRVYKEENTLVIKKDGRVVSALQILPYEMTYFGAMIPVGYICGVCTAPSERGKGLMNQLMIKALEEMRRRGYALAVLIPATPGLFDLYRRFGFENVFDYGLEEVTCGNFFKGTQMTRIRRIGADTHNIYAYYRLKQCERDCCVLHSEEQFETVRQDWMLGKGEIWVALEDEQPVGLAFSILRNREAVSIREIMYENIDVKNALVQFVLNHYQLSKAILRIPPTLSNSLPYGMARIIDLERMNEFLLKYEQRQAFMNLMLE